MASFDKNAMYALLKVRHIKIKWVNDTHMVMYRDVWLCIGVYGDVYRCMVMYMGVW